MGVRHRPDGARRRVWPVAVIKLTLPWPPSVNAYYRHIVMKGAPRTLISADGRGYRAEVSARVLIARAAKRLNSRLAVRIEASPPDRRARDLDNILKSLLDALTYAGVIEDDSLIDDLHLVRCPVVKSGSVSVFITSLEQS